MVLILSRKKQFDHSILLYYIYNYVDIYLNKIYIYWFNFILKMLYFILITRLKLVKNVFSLFRGEKVFFSKVVQNGVRCFENML